MAPKLALCLPGGGATGAMYQLGAVAALEDEIADFDANELDFYVGTSTGACLAAALAGGLPARRLYRAFVDPADVYFPLQRKHVFRMDLREWRRVAGATLSTLSEGVSSWVSRPEPSPLALWLELDRLYDSLPAGVFSLDRFERFLANFFNRRNVPNNFPGMLRPLVVVAHDLDSGEEAHFGLSGLDHVPISRACVASMAYPPFFSPVRIGDRHYIDTGAAQLCQLDVALEQGADVLVVINPMVPVNAQQVPTGRGERPSVKDKGYLWIANQAIRIGMHALLTQAVERIRAAGKHVIVIEPDPGDAILFMHNPASFAARRAILEHAYRTTRQGLAEQLGPDAAVGESIRQAGWRRRVAPAETA